MNPFAVIFAICCLATAQGRPGYSGGGKLVGVPDLSDFGKLSYPKFDVLELGSEIKGSLPPAVVEINKKVIVSVPKPYPVKVPVPVPHPVEVAKPYPVVETKIVKVPSPFPVEVIKKVPYPVEVPKPFPVPSEEFKAPTNEAPVASYGGSFTGGFGLHGAAEVQEEGQEGGGDGGYQGGYDGGYAGSEHAGSYAEADQSQTYGSQVQAQPVGWVPVMIDSQGQQIEEHQQ